MTASGFQKRCKPCQCALVARSAEKKRARGPNAHESRELVDSTDPHDIETIAASEALVQRIGPLVALQEITVTWASRPAADAAFFTTGENA